jgi:hypothetical protein
MVDRANGNLSHVAVAKAEGAIDLNTPCCKGSDHLRAPKRHVTFWTCAIRIKAPLTSARSPQTILSSWE